MRDQTRIIANTLVTYVAQAVVAVVGILLVPFLLHRLGEDAYGVIGVIGSLLQFIILIDLGIRPAAARQFTRFLAEDDRTRANQLASSALAVYGLMTIGILAGSALAGHAFLGWMNVPDPLLDEAFAALMLVSCSLGVALLMAPYGAALASQLRFDWQRYSEIAGQLTRAAFIVALFVWWQPRLTVWAGGALLSALLAFVIQRRQARRVCPDLQLKPALVSRRGFRDLAGFGFYTSLLRLGMWLIQTSGPLIVSFYLGAAAVAHFTPAMMLVISLEPLSRAFLWQLVPVITRAHAIRDYGRIHRVLFRGTRYALLSTGAATVLIAALSPSLIEVWLGPGFDDTAQTLILWCATSLLAAFVGPLPPTFVGTGRLRLIAWLNVFLSVIAVGIGVYLVGYTDFGVAGAAAGMFAVQVVLSAVYLVYATHIWNVDRAQYLRRSFLGPAVCLLVLAVVASTVQQMMGSEPVRALVVGFAIGMPLHGLLAWTIGLDAEDRATALGYLRSAIERLRGS